MRNAARALRRKAAAAALAALAGLAASPARADMVDDAIARAAAARPVAACDGPARRAGLTVENGRVTGAALLAGIPGYAAGSTGGLGGRLAVVTDAGDYDIAAGDAPRPGTLRAAVDAAARAKAPAWIVFGPELGANPRIVLKQPLRLPGDITLDGACAGATILAPPAVSVIQIFNVSNVVLARLAFTKTEAHQGRPDEKSDSCVRLNGAVDRVAIVHGDFESCTDGTIDITVSPKRPVPESASVTVAFNRFRNHDKTMLFGTFTCLAPNGWSCGPDDLALGRATLPKLHLTLMGNLFEGTGQRHPRVFGRVMAHVVNNVVKFQPVRHDDGRFGSGYGVFVSNGARALVERNLFVAGDPARGRLAVWTTTTPGAMRMPEDVAGFIRLDDNLKAGPEIVADNEPDLVPEPIYRRGLARIDAAALGPARFAACIAARAGRDGADGWPAAFCGP